MRPCVGVDLDGTIVACRERQMAALVRAAAAVGLGVQKPDRVWERKRQGASTVEALMAEGVNMKLSMVIADRWREEVERDELLDVDTILPNARTALRRLRHGGWRIAIVTARQRPAAARRQVERLGIAAIADEMHVVPHADVAGEKARVLRMVGAVALVGDTESDAQAAELAAIAFVGVASGQRDARWLSAWVDGPVHQDLASAAAFVMETFSRKGRRNESAER